MPVTFLFIAWDLSVPKPPPVSIRSPSVWRWIGIWILGVMPTWVRPVLLVKCIRISFHVLVIVSWTPVIFQPICFHRLTSLTETFIFVSIFILPVPDFSQMSGGSLLIVHVPPTFPCNIIFVALVKERPLSSKSFFLQLILISA